MPPQALDALAPHFFQVAYVTRDIAGAEDWFKRIMGVPAFTRMENVAFGADCTFRGAPADCAAHLSLGYLRETQVELIEPVRGKSLYTEFLDERGPGLHHVAFDVPDFSATVSALCESGLEMIMRGQVGPGSDFAYFDTGEAETSVIEILGFSEAIRAFMKQLREQGA